METLIQKITALATISQKLEPNHDERVNFQNDIHNFTKLFIESIDQNKAFVNNHQITQNLKIDLKEKSLESLLKLYHNEVVDKGLNAASGGHLAYIPGGGIYTSALADYLAAVTNEYAGMFYGSPGAVTIEHELIDWMKSVFGFPENAIGNLTSGGSIANLVALTAARDAHEIKNQKIEKSVIYLSEQVHHCIHKALRIIGLEDVIIKSITLDQYSRIDSAALEKEIIQDINNDLIPFMVIASAGTTDTGAIDPLEKIGQIAKKNQLWYHIDGAYGGFFILVEDKKEAFKGIELADSLVVDPHKSLFLPYGLGAVLVKNKEAVFKSHHYTANYMQDAIENNVLNPADVSPELTKHFRGLRLWIPLQLHGITPFAACLEEKLHLTAYFRTLLKNEGFELGPTPDLSVSYFWYPSINVDQNTFNKKLLEHIHHDGRVFLSSTQIKGQFVIRMAILSFRTKKHTIDLAMKMINECISKTKLYFSN